MQHHYIRHLLEDGELTVTWVPTADLLLGVHVVRTDVQIRGNLLKWPCSIKQVARACGSPWFLASGITMVIPNRSRWFIKSFFGRALVIPSANMSGETIGCSNLRFTKICVGEQHDQCTASRRSCSPWVSDGYGPGWRMEGEDNDEKNLVEKVLHCLRSAVRASLFSRITLDEAHKLKSVKT